MKVVILGLDCSVASSLSIGLANHGHEVVLMTPFEENTSADIAYFNENERVEYLFSFKDFEEIKPIHTYKKDDSFRGGSRGKGGKTKYKRR
tara:strand:+ start:300 stop:572 length:273 start_codon:yes stop_codon:yes gene_type:complete